MIKKTFILTQFGTPHAWTEQYFKHIGHLGNSGWHWLIFTPHHYEAVPSNVTIVHMAISEFNVLVEQKLGINPDNFINQTGLPNKAISDFYVASGKIFQDYLTDTDYWGITNWDIVYGNLSKFIPDNQLRLCDIFSDDVNAINGIFSLFKNTDHINNLFTRIPDWKRMFTTHSLFGTDEYYMTNVVRDSNEILFGYPPCYPLHSHDRLEQHVPDVKLQLKSDGSLWELFKDINGPNWEHARPFMGKEIAYFHFLRTKKWPLD